MAPAHPLPQDTSMMNDPLRRYIRDVPDFPRPGIVFRDITPLLADAPAFDACIARLAGRVAGHRPDAIIAVESRGFLFGAPLARELGKPLQIVRKRGKLPHVTVSETYELEYGTDLLEVHADALTPGTRYAIVDDVLATGGTAAATARLVERQLARVACCAFVIELGFLAGRARLGEYPVEALIDYPD